MPGGSPKQSAGWPRDPVAVRTFSLKILEKVLNQPSTRNIPLPMKLSEGVPLEQGVRDQRVNISSTVMSSERASSQDLEGIQTPRLFQPRCLFCWVKCCYAIRKTFNRLPSISPCL